ncbi:Rho GTPase-activating protein 1 [Heracleum sosnowskyi]|uniref:Rho GTPase-activating protein 1 n=1 Tax=Heracleum sosnowskyi TaxID=360622 RepID=A0AAD8LXW9_9APIA|nr:Rho GTPase-activating protein 1 [Heracleum sosnowskyi]
MTEVLQSPSSSSSSSSVHSFQEIQEAIDIELEEEERVSNALIEEIKKREKDDDQLSLLALLVTLIRKSSFWVSRRNDSSGTNGGSGLDIGWPTNVQHVAHVTFDRFNGFLGLPVEFELEVPLRAPSASTTVFGVSTDSMQLSYDHRGNSVPTILLLMQQRLYAQGGLQAEGIFRINAENSQEEFVRNQLNAGVVPAGIDLHCLAGLIKAWFRELPEGILDTLSPEQVMQCQSEEDCSALVRLLPTTEGALLDWAINLMADVVQHEHFNKMNAHNIAMVFAPNMTQMADPLTALMYAVRVMNFLKALIAKTLQTREDSLKGPTWDKPLDPSEENEHQGPSLLFLEDANEENEEREKIFIAEDPYLKSSSDSTRGNIIINEVCSDSSTPAKESGLIVYSEAPTNVSTEADTQASVKNSAIVKLEKITSGSITDQSRESDENKTPQKFNALQLVIRSLGAIDRSEADTQASVKNSAIVKLEKITSGSNTDQSCESEENKTTEKFNALQLVIRSLGAIDRSEADTQASVKNSAIVKLEKITSGSITDQSCESDENKTPEKFNALQLVIQSLGAIDRSKILGRVNSLTGR